MADETPTRLEALSAYTLSAATTLLWVGCVLPAGILATPGLGGDDAATPIHREKVLLVPALLLLVLVPAGCTLARRVRGMRAVLAGTDGFVAAYAGIALAVAVAPHGEAFVFVDYLRANATTLIAVTLLLILGFLSGLEAWRCARGSAPEWRRGRFAGSRLGICLLVLILPLHIFLKHDVERASLLGPFVFVAVSAAGVSLARSMRGLRRTAGVLQLLMTAHLLITLRLTMFRRDPVLDSLEITGRATLAVAAGLVVLAGFQLLLLMRRGEPQPMDALISPPDPHGIPSPTMPNE